MTGLSDHTIAVVKSTVPALEAHGVEITTAMYKKLMKNDVARPLFNQSHVGEGGGQIVALANAIIAYAKNIDNLSVLAGAVERIAQKHIGSGVEPEHYAIVGQCLMASIHEVLGTAVTDEVDAAWVEAYTALADIFINREKDLYSDLANAKGGWKGLREFTVEDKVHEAKDIVSFYLVPTDGGEVIVHKPGQYLTFLLPVDGEPSKRNYSISSAPSPRGYRITVKRAGRASSWLHDNVSVGHHLNVIAPCGEFVLEEHPRSPIILLGAGVGLTPFVSMMKQAASAQTEVPLHLIYSTQNSGTRPLSSELNQLKQLAPHSVAVTTFYTSPLDKDAKGIDFDVLGRINLSWLKQHTLLEDAEYFICGPPSFIADFSNHLKECGVKDSNVHYEFFGPTTM